MSTRVETHIVKSNLLDELSFISKNVYNWSLFQVRKEFIENGKFLGYSNTNQLIKAARDFEAEYSTLPAQTIQSILRLLEKNWKSFFRAIKAYSKSKAGFKGQPKLPGYMDKNGRNILIYPGQNIKIKNGILKIPKTGIKIITSVEKENLKQVRIIPKGYKTFKVEIVYNKPVDDLGLNKAHAIGIDIGLNNLMAITSNQPGSLNCLINGSPLKSLNQFYNKMATKAKSKLKIINNSYWSRKLNTLTMKRDNKISDYLHKASRLVIDLCKQFDIGQIVIGHNDGWKQKINIGKKNNQNFVQVPFNKLIAMIQYKAEEVGIEVILTEESYTSKCDHLAQEEMIHHKNYLGKRIRRGLFKSSTGQMINADINGALGILRKVNAVSKEFLAELRGNRGCVLQPIKLNC